MTDLVCIVSDTHINSRVGLLPPTIKLDDGDTIKASKAQRWLWHQWKTFWDDVAEERRRTRGAKLYVIVNGDIADYNKHATSQMITTNIADIIKMSYKVFDPCLSIADHVFVTRGTEAHALSNASLDELFARDIDAVSSDEDTSSWWWLRAKFGGVKFDVAHHAGTGSLVPHGAHGPAGRVAARIMHDYATKAADLPNVAVRSHNHIFSDSGETYPVRAIVTEPWQLTTSFGHRIGMSGRLLPVGGLLFTCDRGTYSLKKLSYTPKLRKYWTANEL
jgi:hypothetical protein